MSSDPFYSSLLKVKNAIDHMHRIDRLLVDYGKRLTISYQCVAGNTSLKRLTFSEPHPVELPLYIGDAVHNLRASLDLMMCDIGRRQLKDSSLISKVDFPIADSPEKLEESIRRNPAFKQFDPRILETVQACRPYKGGNQNLYAIHRLDIEDKHRLILPTIAVAWGRTQNEFMALSMGAPRDQIEFDAPDIMMAKINGHAIAFVGQNLPTLDVEGALLDAAIADRVYPEPFRADHTPTALFASDSELPGVHVLEGLENMFKETFATLEKFREWAF